MATVREKGQLSKQETWIEPIGIAYVGQAGQPVNSAGWQPARSLAIQTYFESKSLVRFCCEFLNLQHLAESAFSRVERLNEAQTRHAPSHKLEIASSVFAS
jgi:hypothetical protein